MFTALIIIVGVVAVSAAIFVILRKNEKTEVEPLGYEAAPTLEPLVELVEKKKTAKPKTSKNTAKNKSLAKMEAKPKKTTKVKK